MTEKSNVYERPLVNGGIYRQSEFHAYEVVEWKIDAPDCTEAGKLVLQDLNTKSIDSYTIWQGDEGLSYYYVCIDAEEQDDAEEDDELEVVNLEGFGIHVFTFANLSQEARIKAAGYYAVEKRREGCVYTLQHAYRKLLKGQARLFDIEGRPAWNSWAGKINVEERHYV